jgi:hypothetical protein
MSTIVTRAGKGSPLTHNEVDANFNNLNSDKYQANDNPTFGTVNATTLDATNVEVTNVKAKDGTAAITIADTSGNVGIGGTADAFAKVHVLGTLPTSSNASQGFRMTGEIPSGSTGSARSFLSFPSTAAASFTLSTLRHFEAFQGTFGASSIVTNQFGFFADASLTGATNNYGFYSNIASGSNRWNFYAAGTAANFFNGQTDVGNTRLIASNTWNGAHVRSASTITLASGASIDLSTSVAGGAIVSVYASGSGNGGLFWVNYSETVTKLVGNGEATDTGGDFAVYKSATSHTSTLKNKAGSSQTFYVAVLSGQLI